MVESLDAPERNDNDILSSRSAWSFFASLRLSLSTFRKKDRSALL